MRILPQVSGSTTSTSYWFGWWLACLLGRLNAMRVLEWELCQRLKKGLDLPSR